jgi:hypothetical protein
LTGDEKDAFKKLLDEDGFYSIRLLSNVLDPARKDYVVSSIKARCIPRESLDEHIVIHMDGVNILAVNYGSVGGCTYPRPVKMPSKWVFNSYTVLKTSEQAPRTPSFVDQLIEAENGLGEVVKSPEKSFWAKYVSNSCKYLRKLFLVPFNLTIASCFSVDVHHSSWSHCHECCHGSSEHAGGASWRAGPTWSSKGTKCCSKEKMISVLPIWFLSRL